MLWPGSEKSLESFKFSEHRGFELELITTQDISDDLSRLDERTTYDAMEFSEGFYRVRAWLFGTFVVPEEEGDAATTLLVKGDLEGLRNGLLARAVEASEEDDEALLEARGVALTERLHNSTDYQVELTTPEIKRMRGRTRKRTSRGWAHRS